MSRRAACSHPVQGNVVTQARKAFHNDLAVILFGRGEVREARALLEKALWINPHHQSLAGNYAAVLEKLGDTAGAARFRAGTDRPR